MWFTFHWIWRADFGRPTAAQKANQGLKHSHHKGKNEESTSSKSSVNGSAIF